MTVRMEIQILAHSMSIFDRIKLRLGEGKELTQSESHSRSKSLASQKRS